MYVMKNILNHQTRSFWDDSCLSLSRVAQLHSFVPYTNHLKNNFV